MPRQIEGILWLTSVISLLVAALAPARSYLLVLVAVVWVGATAVVIPLHFFRAWRRLGSVSNRGEYALWVGFETLFAAGLVAGFVLTVSSR